MIISQFSFSYSKISDKTVATFCKAFSEYFYQLPSNQNRIASFVKYLAEPKCGLLLYSKCYFDLSTMSGKLGRKRVIFFFFFKNHEPVKTKPLGWLTPKPTVSIFHCLKMTNRTQTAPELTLVEKNRWFLNSQETSGGAGQKFYCSQISAIFKPFCHL